MNLELKTANVKISRYLNYADNVHKRGIDANILRSTRVQLGVSPKEMSKRMSKVMASSWHVSDVYRIESSVVPIRDALKYTYLKCLDIVG